MIWMKMRPSVDSPRRTFTRSGQININKTKKKRMSKTSDGVKEILNNISNAIYALTKQMKLLYLQP